MKIVKTSELPWADAIDKGPFKQRRKPLGGDRLPCGMWELAPGKKSFPYHGHHVTEEAMFVLSGRGKVRSPEGLSDIGPGDYVSFPADGTPHQLINDGEEPLVYLGLAATSDADVVEYPDSGKIATRVGTAGSTRVRTIFKKDAQVDYFEGELD